MTTRAWTSGLVILLTILLATSPAWSQGNQGTIEGILVDQSGAAVPAAKLTAANKATGIKFQTTSDSNGLFTFPTLPVGTYTLEVEHAGFVKLTEKDVALTVGARLNLTLTLAVAGQAQSVVVTSENPIVETTRSQVSSTVNDIAVENLPTNGRNFINFVLLTPGVTLDVRGGDISFAGQRGTLNSLIVDGSDNNNTFFGQSVGRTGSGRAPYQFSEDAVQEFQVNSNAYSAELGHAGGAVINVVTKSGTNQFHGAGFEFFRDQGLNANDPINKIKGLRTSAAPSYGRRCFSFLTMTGNETRSPIWYFSAWRHRPRPTPTNKRLCSSSKHEPLPGRGHRTKTYTWAKWIGV